MEEKRENQRVMLTKRLLKNSLVELLSEKDIYKLSVKELCERAGINRSTFYKYYGSQYDVLDEMQEEVMERLRSCIRQVEPRDGQGPDLRPVAALMAYIDGNIGAFRLYFNNDVGASFEERLMQLTMRLLVSSELLRPQRDHADFDALLTFLISGCFAVIKKWVNDDVREPPEAFARKLYVIATGALTGCTEACAFGCGEGAEAAGAAVRPRKPRKTP